VHPLTIIGNEGSPYSRKMRAVLRYRQIPHRWVVQQGPEYVAPPKPAVDVIPVLVWHDDDGRMRESMVDSTPQIRRLEREFSGRSIVPSDPALDFIAALVEDYGDEWCTKFMFHYRWADPAGIEWSRRQLIREINPSATGESIEHFSSWFAPRQMGRRSVVGSTEATAPVLEAGYRRLLGLLEGILARRQFLLGDRPSIADFGLYGQLTQLCGFDPSSRAIAQERAPRVVAWVTRLDDLSGWRVEDKQWLPRAAAIELLRPLLVEIGTSYVPFLLANAAAKAAGQEEVRCEVGGAQWVQKVFGYQVKCLKWLREQFAALSADDQAWVRAELDATRCGALVAA
jgi:glutathione S-transferase